MHVHINLSVYLACKRLLHLLEPLLFLFVHLFKLGVVLSINVLSIPCPLLLSLYQSLIHFIDCLQHFHLLYKL